MNAALGEVFSILGRMKMIRMFFKKKRILSVASAVFFVFSALEAQGEGAGWRNGSFQKEILLEAWKERRNIVFSPYLVDSTVAVLGYGLGRGFYKKLVDVFGLTRKEKDSVDESNLREISEYGQGRGGVLSFEWEYAYRQVVEPTPLFEKIIDILKMKAKPGMAPVKVEDRGGFLGKFEDEPLFTIETIIRFHGKWASPFHRRETKKGVFFCDLGKGIIPYSADFMRGKKNCYFAYGKGFKALSLDFEGGVALLVVLPFRGVDLSWVLSHISLSGLLLEVSGKNEAKWKNPGFVDIEIPKVHFASKKVIPMFLRGKIGKDAFLANFGEVSRIFKFQKRISMDEFEIKAEDETEIMWDEEGSRFSSRLKWTAAGIIGSVKPFSFHADRPFLFFVIDKKGINVLLSGLLCRPGGKRWMESEGISGRGVEGVEDPAEEVAKKIVFYRFQRTSPLKGHPPERGSELTPWHVEDAFRFATDDLRLSILDWIAENKKGKSVLPYTKTLLFGLYFCGKKVREKALDIMEKKRTLGDFDFILRKYGKKKCAFKKGGS